MLQLARYEEKKYFRLPLANFEKWNFATVMRRPCQVMTTSVLSLEMGYRLMFKPFWIIWNLLMYILSLVLRTKGSLDLICSTGMNMKSATVCPGVSLILKEIEFMLYTCILLSILIVISKFTFYFERKRVHAGYLYICILFLVSIFIYNFLFFFEKI